MPDRFEKFELRGGTAQVQARVSQAFRKQFAEQTAFVEQLTAERAADVDNAVETVADVFHVPWAGFVGVTGIQLQQMKIVETERSLLPVRESQWVQ